MLNEWRVKVSNTYGKPVHAERMAGKVTHVGNWYLNYDCQTVNSYVSGTIWRAVHATRLEGKVTGNSPSYCMLRVRW